MSAPNGNKPRLGLTPLMRSLMSIYPGKRAPLPSPDVGEQETQLRIEYKPGGVRICFSQSVTWVGFDPAGAEELAATLLEFAKLAREAEEPQIITPPGIILPS